MKRTILAVLLAGAAILPGWAQSAQQPYPQLDEGDAPDHGVARISVINGDVSVRHGDSGDLTAAALNGPLFVNDVLATGQGAAAEIQFDAGNMMRVGSGAEVRMGELEYGRYLVQVATGTTTFRVLRSSRAEVEISTPTVSVRPAEQGIYRVTVMPDGTTEITVRSGRADIFSPRGSEALTAGRTLQARGDPSDPEYMIVAALPLDQWDRWNDDRDRLLQGAVSTRYVSPDVYGAEELDSYGQWQNDPEYGNVWVPQVDANWAPYRDGRWENVDYYGWTWISGDPWGWAPYHYGNWYQSSFGWAWYPGPIGGRHYWRPAMVSFFGWGSPGLGLSVGFGYGNVGWVPLAPRERFRPWYGRGFNNTTIVNNTTVINNYRNARFVNGRSGVTSINAGDFGRRGINTSNFVRATNNDLVRAGSVQGRLPFTASRESRRMSDRPVSNQAVPRVTDNTRFYSRGAGNRAQTQQQQVQQRFPQNQTPQNASPRQVPQQVPRQVPQQVQQNSGNWRRFDGAQPGNRQAPPSRNGMVQGPSNVQQPQQRQQFPQQQVQPQQPPFQQQRPQFQQPQQQRPQQQPPQQNRPPIVRDNAVRDNVRENMIQQQRQQQPVRISPPMVQRQQQQAPAATPVVSRPETPRNSFGTPRPQGGGESRGNSGGNRGNGNGNGNRGGGESRGNGGGNGRR